jgi:hypothetical protein
MQSNLAVIAKIIGGGYLMYNNNSGNNSASSTRGFLRRAFGISTLGAGLVLGMASLSARADTIAYYRFETGPAGAVATSIIDWTE